MNAQQVVDAYREARETLEADPQYGRAALPEHWAKFDGLEAEAVEKLAWEERGWPKGWREIEGVA